MATRRTPLAKTVQRGYGYQHKRRVAAERNGQWGRPCARCGAPMERGQQLFLDHRDDRMGYLGWSHAKCDIAASNRRRAALARAQGTVKGRHPRRARRVPDAPPASTHEPTLQRPDGLPPRQHTRAW
jgi:hypothetical protein